jgi:hypothetical protein
MLVKVVQAYVSINTLFPVALAVFQDTKVHGLRGPANGWPMNLIPSYLKLAGGRSAW